MIKSDIWSPWMGNHFIKARKKRWRAPKEFKKRFLRWCLLNRFDTVAERLNPFSLEKKKRDERKKVRHRFFTGKREYYRETYLQSEHWDELRASKLILTPNCERCGKRGKMDVHHKAYRHLYDVRIEDLETLCRRCHNRHHETNVRKIFKRFLKDKMR